MSFSNIIFWEEFIDKYKSFPQLWQIKSDVYHNKQLKINAYNELKEKLCEIEKNATIDMVKRKINNLRACYRRELKKVRQSEKSGAGVDDLYVPTLWYFEKLHFLKDQECQLDGISSVDVETGNEEMEFSPQPKKLKRVSEIKRHDLLMRAVNSLENDKKGDTEILGQCWASLYKKLDERQQLFANRTISEVLYQGALGNLNETSWRAFEKQTNFQTTSLPSVTHSPYSSSSGTSLSNYSDNPVYISTPLPSPQYTIVRPVKARLTAAQQTPETGEYLSVQDLLSDESYN